ncbi:hypothetical protein [Haloterrigena alkaliphila]|uniref:Uncharacterized protein n=1 Tax=Haloterrigena alkaliphila TaxID=2816475 RepID=A0A8A2V854_9EURY|nr:hypothetical protein [Haloterrigena alkaliphila]QSW98129.1 hypothetical protein J0X25_11980 [Haloterrigena alkaliphila]
MSQDSQDLHDRVTEILNAAETSSGSMLGGENGDGTDLLETAEEASDLLESAEPNQLLAAVGLDTLPDGSEPNSIPAAIAQGDPEQVADLQRLLHLSNLADGDGDDEGTLEGAVDELRASIGEREGASSDSDAEEGEGDADGESDAGGGSDDEAEDGLLESVLGSSEEGDSADGDGGAEAEDADEADESDESESEGGAREAIESAAETVSEAGGLDGVLESEDDESAESEDGEADGDETSTDDGGDIGDRLRSAVESSLTDVGDDLEGLQDRLQNRSASAVGGDETDDDENNRADDAEEDEDDGPLDTDLGSSEKRTGGGDGTRHSTMAPPPSERADMRASTRHSTMPRRH